MDRESHSWVQRTNHALLALIESGLYFGDKDNVTWSEDIKAFVPPVAQASLHSLPSHEFGEERTRALQQLVRHMAWSTQLEYLEEMQHSLEDSPHTLPDNLEQTRQQLSDAFLVDVVERSDTDQSLRLWAAGVLMCRSEEGIYPSRGVQACCLPLVSQTHKSPMLGDVREELRGQHPALFASLLTPDLRAQALLEGPIEDLPDRLASESRDLEAAEERTEFLNGIFKRISWLSSREADVKKRECVIQWASTCNEKDWKIHAADLVQAVSHGADQNQFSSDSQNTLKGYATVNHVASVEQAVIWATGLATWLRLVAQTQQAHALSNRLAHGLLEATSLFQWKHREEWQNHYTSSLDPESEENVANSLIAANTAAGKPDTDLYYQIPTNCFRFLFYDIVRRAREANTGKSSKQLYRVGGDESENYFNAVLNLETQTFETKTFGKQKRVRRERQPRFTRFVEAYLDFIRKTKGVDGCQKALDKVTELNVARTARMWESLVAAHSLKDSRNKKARRVLREEANKDLQRRKFTAGLWTTFIVGELQVERKNDPHSWPKRVATAQQDGDNLLRESLTQMSKSRVLDDNDKWFSFREARRILLSYPSQKESAYNLLEVQWSSAVNEQRSTGAEVSVFTSEMIYAIASAHTLEGNTDGLERMIDIGNIASLELDTEKLDALKGPCYQARIKNETQSRAEEFLQRQPEPSRQEMYEAFDGLLAKFTADDAEYSLRCLNNYLWSLSLNQPSISELTRQWRDAAREYATDRGYRLDIGLEDSTDGKPSVNVLEGLRGTLRLVAHDIGQPLTNLNDRVENLHGSIVELSEEWSRTQSVEDLGGRLDKILAKAATVATRTENLDAPLGVLAAATKDDAGIEVQSVANIAEDLKQALEKNSSNRSIQVVDHTMGAATTVQRIASTLILDTLLLNALEHGKEKVTVTISAPLGSNTIDVLISDEGKGLPKETVEGLHTLRPTSSPDKGDDLPGRGIMSARFTAEALGGSLVGEQQPDGRVFPKLSLPLHRSAHRRPTNMRRDDVQSD